MSRGGSLPRWQGLMAVCSSSGSAAPHKVSAVSPVLANLFLHYGFDAWMTRNYPGVVFKRYADDAVVHCATKQQAQRLLAAIGNRMSEVGLALHPSETRIVYCKDGRRRGDHEHVAFTFLGFTFRARAARSRTGASFTGSCPRLASKL
jgi:RNA-directed DNA polymerase